MTNLEIVRNFVIENFLYGDSGRLHDDTLFSEDGIIDSTGVLELVGFLEERFGIQVEDEDFSMENMNSLRRIDAFLVRKLSQNHSQNLSQKMSL